MLTHPNRPFLEVKHPSEEAVEESLKRVSSPSSSTYGRYWSLDAPGTVCEGRGWVARSGWVKR